ncbi:protein kinase [Rheinheimera sp.]|uniref:protein kinase n=1 Tax=Rheinheimera sp. TaxID=1869214 RepID=UPI00307D8E6D
MQLSADKSSVKWSAALTTFPQQLVQYAGQLEQIDLSDNLLSDLPEELSCFVRLKRLFLTNNQFRQIPAVLAQCPQLEMISFKGNGLTEFAEGVLPDSIRWLILTDNQLTALPADMGRYRQLQKVALAANRLRALPESMQDCTSVALLRLSLNRLTTVPDWLFQLPKLAWLSVGANPACFARPPVQNLLPDHQAERYTQLDLLGQGASGLIYRVRDQYDGSEWALKQFKGRITTDGCPEEELWNSVRCSGHANLIPLRAEVRFEDTTALVMQLIPPGFRPLGLVPSFSSISRDCYAAGFTLSRSQLLKVALQVAATMAHLHHHAVCHGDLYAHNMLVDPDYQLYLGDFGAATALDNLTPLQQQAFKALDIRAFGYLLQDLRLHCTDPVQGSDPLWQLEVACLQHAVQQRPDFAWIERHLSVRQK